MTAAEMYAALRDLGNMEAFDATYQAPDDVALVPCIVLKDVKDAIRDGSGPVVGIQTELSLLLSQVPSPQRGGRVACSNGETWMLDDPVGGNSEESRWVVIRARP